jgi:hypothetical protein
LPQASPREGESPVEGARRLLETAILIGGVVVCPGCGEACEKDDACMHMECRCGAWGGLSDCRLGNDERTRSVNPV